MSVKVPDATPSFWLTKVLTTGMGEATSDYFVHRFDPVIAVAVAGLIFFGSLIWQLLVRRYVVWIYWFAVVMVSVFGTMVADVLHVGFKVPYVVSAPLFAVILACILAGWRISEQTLSIHSICTRRRELFYWGTVLATFALGTAAGDLTAMTLRLGYLASGIVFAGLIAVPAVAYWRSWMNEVTAFWFAYIVTRPLGASFADWMGKPHSLGGLGWGDGTVSLMATVLILICVTAIALTTPRVSLVSQAATADEG